MTCKYKDWDVHGDPCRECEDCQLHEDEDRRGMAEDAKYWGYVGIGDNHGK